MTLTNEEICLLIICIIGIISVFGLVMLVAIEAAYSSCNLTEDVLEKLKEQKANHRAKLLWLFGHPVATHCALQNYKTVATATLVASILFGMSLFSMTPLCLTLTWLGVIIVLSAISALTVRLAQGQHLSILKRATVVTYALARSMRLLQCVTGNNEENAESSDTFSVEGLGQALEMQSTDEEKNILKGALHFGEETVADIMVPRVDIVYVDINADFSQVMKCVIDNNYSRIPVHDEAQDKIRGILYAKDLLPHCRAGKDFDWKKLIRPAFFVPESKMIDDLLREFQKGKIHIAVVVDEYGITSGIVTMEDILEEIVGEINDEYDEEERHFVRLDDNNYVFEGKTPITDFFEILHLDAEDFADAVGDAETLAGFMLELLNEFPSKHQKASYHQFTFEVLALDKRRISKIKVTINPEKPEPDASNHR